MSLITKIFTAIRGFATETAESVVDAHSITILEQEIKDAEKNLESAKEDLADVLAQEMQAARKIEKLQREVNKYESYAKQALKENKEDLAIEVAEKLAVLKQELTLEQTISTELSSNTRNLQSKIAETSQVLKQMKHNFVMIKSTEKIQKASAAISSNYTQTSSKLLSAKSTMDRIKKRQQHTFDKMNAGRILESNIEGQHLEQKLTEAGLKQDKNSAENILAQLKLRNK